MAIGTSGIFEVDNSSGNDSLNAGFFNSNGSGAGTDYSITSPIACTDLVIDATTNTNVTSASIGFTSAHVRNGLRITSGTGFTTGLFEIISVSGGIATLDRSAGTTGSTGGTARVGGALASPGGAGALFTAGSSQGVFIKNTGTNYLIGSGANSAGNQLNIYGTNTGLIFIVGYQTNRTKYNTDTSPTVVPNANSLSYLINGNTYSLISNIKADNSSAGKTSCTAFGCDDHSTVFNCLADSFSTGFNIFSNVGFGQYTNFVGCTAKSPSGTGFNLGGSYPRLVGCVCLDGTGNHFESTGPSTFFLYCISRSVASAKDGYRLSGNGSFLWQCISYNANNDGFGNGSSSALGTKFINCIAIGSNGYGFRGNTASILVNCTSYNCSSGNDDGSYSLKVGNISLAGDPFVNAAGGDFTLNATYGASLKAAGFPQSILGLSGTNNLDIGCYQHAAGSSGSSGLFIPMSGGLI